MPTYGELIAPIGELALLAAERLLKDIEPARFGAFARPGGVVVYSNHPAFVFGHLALYPAKALAVLGRPVGAAQCPASYEPLFKAGVDCLDDPDGTIYPARDEIVAHFFDGYRAAIAAIRATPDDAMQAPNPNEGRSRELFPTVGAMLAFYVGGHTQMHLGQVSAWRRAMGQSPA